MVSDHRQQQTAQQTASRSLAASTASQTTSAPSGDDGARRDLAWLESRFRTEAQEHRRGGRLTLPLRSA